MGTLSKDVKNFKPSYVGQREDVEALIPSRARLVLDVGCSTGVLGLAIKARTGAQVFGIEISKEMADEARKRLDRVFIGDVTEILREMEGRWRFDLIIFADLLEHLVDPWKTMALAVAHLAPGGVVVASIPNVCHVSTIWSLVVKGYWPYRERGIHDRTHLRFFCRKNIVELFHGSGLLIDKMLMNYRIIERHHPVNRFAKLLAIPWISRFFVFQYLIRAHMPSVVPGDE